MGTDIAQLRRNILGSDGRVIHAKAKQELLDFLGAAHEERVARLIQRVIGKSDGGRRKIFDYIVDFWESALIEAPYKEEEYRGINLSRRPFLAPSIPSDGKAYAFAEQYRWDTYFHNLGFILAGGNDLAAEQLMNFVDVFDEYRRIPNALVSSYLSHAQPPLEAFGIYDLIEAGVKDERIDLLMNMVESELFMEWWDRGRGKRYERQTTELAEKYGLLTRYTNIHFHPLLAGCEDGKDHNWVTVMYGANYLPVQLNSLVYGTIDRLERYFGDKSLGNDMKKACIYEELKNRMRDDFQKVFWVESGKWKGFRNYSIKEEAEGSILYGDLSAEIFPLFVKIATNEQAEITKENLVKYYEGEYGLSATSKSLREGGGIPCAPAGEWQFQWEYPNMWAPLMYIACTGLKNYGYNTEALRLEKKWVDHVEVFFEKNGGGFAEKYAFSPGLEVENGFYGNIKGFGWTIAVYLKFLHDLEYKE